MKLKGAGVTAIGLGLGIVSASAVAVTPLDTRRIASGLLRPVWVTHAPGDSDRIFILEKRGIVKVMNLNNNQITVVMNIDSIVFGGTSDFNEQGLLGLAFHPDWESNGYFYVYYTRDVPGNVPTEDGDTQISRYTLTGNTASTASALPILTIDQPQGNHNGGWINFGPDDYLYIATGDGGGANDTGTGHTSATGNSQDTTNNLLGKILRIDVDGDDFPSDPAANYAIPGDNPFAAENDNRDDEIWVYGLRNPWRNAFDKITGDLYLADVGQGNWEEISVLPGGGVGGENLGWRCREGAHNFNFQAYCSDLTFVEPVHEYNHGQGCSITGGEVYRGCAIPDLRGTYFFADYCSNQIWSFRYDSDTNTISSFQTRTAELAPGSGQSILGPSSFGVNNDGEMYICDQPGGEIFQIVPGATPDPPTPNDYDNNGVVDLLDLAGLTDCLDQGGPAVKVPCLCDVFDDDGDKDVDLSSYARFQRDY